MDNRFRQIQELASNTANIRNISIIAHVDHGKTTLTDQLLSSNNIISKKLAGSLRYMDNREDEQLRGITMKSSSISVVHKDYLINIIDSPGHVEFSSEVSAALRLTDGALVLIDVLEGFSSQTYTVLKQMFEEGIKGILVLNKIDRLILEQQMDPDQAYMHLSQIIDQVNATLNSFLNENIQQQTVHEFSLEDDLEEIENKLYFSPEKNNVIFSSALDSWAFTIENFAEIFAVKLKCKKSSLMKCLWGNYYIKNKRIYDKPMREGQSVVFVDFILKNIWGIYHNKDDIPKLQQIAKSLQIDGQINFKNLMAKWLPLDQIILNCVINVLPSPIHAQEQKVSIIAKRLQKQIDKNGDQALKVLQEGIRTCDKNGPLVVFIAKMIAVPPECIDEKQLSQRNEQTLSYGFARVFSGTLRRGQQIYVIGPKSKIITSEIQIDQSDIQQFIVQRLYQMMAQNLDGIQHVHAGNLVAIGDLDDLVFKTATLSDIPICPSLTPNMKFKSILKTMLLPINLLDQPKLLQGIKRLYKSDPSLEVTTLDSGEIILGTCGQVHLQRCITDLEKLTQCKVKISDPIIPYMETITYKSLTEESNEKYNKKKAKVLQQKVVKKYVEEKSKDDDVEKEQQVKYKQNLLQAEDTETVETGKQDYDDLRYNQKQVQDVKWKYQQVQQKQVDHKNKAKQQSKLNLLEVYNKSNLIEESTANQQVTIKVRAIGLPFELALWLENNSKFLRKYFYEQKQSENTFLEEWDVIKKELKIEKRLIDLIENHLYCFGPKKSGPNLLILKQLKKEDSVFYQLRNSQNGLQQFQQQQEVALEVQEEQTEDKVDSTKDSKSQLSQQQCVKALEQYLNSQEINMESMFKSMAIGFDMALTSGPLCAEPIIGACYIVESIQSQDDQLVTDTYGPISGQFISAMKDACLNSFLGAQPRLVESVYKCTLQTNYDHYGKVFDVLGQRRAKILSDVLNESTSLFMVSSHLPVSTSFDFYSAIQTATSGHVTAQLDFDGWVILDIDPFYHNYTEEDMEENGDQQLQKNVARDLIMATRKRKGMNYEEKIVVAADKQRNLSRKK